MEINRPIFHRVQLKTIPETSWCNCVGDAAVRFLVIIFNLINYSRPLSLTTLFTVTKISGYTSVHRALYYFTLG